MKKNFLTIMLLFCWSIVKAQSGDTPKWVMTEWTNLTAEGGHWIADNLAHKSENEPYDAYGLEWSWGIGNKSVIGRLYGIINNKDIGTFWEFRNYWDPKQKKYVLIQFGSDGTFGSGSAHLNGNIIEAIQTFYAPNGSSYMVRHESETTSKLHMTTSFRQDENGKWVKNRNYTWHKKPTRR